MDGWLVNYLLNFFESIDMICLVIIYYEVKNLNIVI